MYANESEAAHQFLCELVDIAARLGYYAQHHAEADDLSEHWSFLGDEYWRIIGIGTDATASGKFWGVEPPEGAWWVQIKDDQPEYHAPFKCIERAAELYKEFAQLLAYADGYTKQ